MQIRKVLLVDDADEIRNLGRLALERIGKWEVVVAASGDEAVAQAEAELPDLIVLDVLMPGMDGPTTLRTLRERGVETPVLFLTARALPEQIDELLALGAVGVLTKPFHPTKLPQQIRDLVETGQTP